MAEIKPGKYVGRARAKSEHYDIAGPRERLPFGMSQNNQPQIALDFDLETQKGDPVGCITIAMSLSKKALPYTVERLRACGWAGKNILELHGVDDQRVQVEVFVQKNPQSGRDQLRAEVVTGGAASTFKMKNPIPIHRLDDFAAYVTRGIEAMPAPKANAATGELVSQYDGSVPDTNDEIPF